MKMIRMVLDLTQNEFVESSRASHIFFEQLEPVAHCMYCSYQDSPDYEEDSEHDFSDELANVFDGLYGEFLPEHSFIIENDDFVSAGLIVCLFKGEPHITYAFTRPEFQGNGLGTELLSHACFCLKKSGFRHLYLYLNLENRPAYNLYDNFGFEEIEEL